MTMLLDFILPKTNPSEADIEATTLTHEFPKFHNDSQQIGINRDFEKRISYLERF